MKKMIMVIAFLNAIISFATAQVVTLADPIIAGGKNPFTITAILPVDDTLPIIQVYAIEERHSVLGADTLNAKIIFAGKEYPGKLIVEDWTWTFTGPYGLIIQRNLVETTVLLPKEFYKKVKDSYLEGVTTLRGSFHGSALVILYKNSNY